MNIAYVGLGIILYGLFYTVTRALTILLHAAYYGKPLNGSEGFFPPRDIFLTPLLGELAIIAVTPIYVICGVDILLRALEDRVIERLGGNIKDNNDR